MTQIGEVSIPRFVAIEFFSENPARNSAFCFDLHPPLAGSVLDDVNLAAALAKARSETTVALYRYCFFPLREPPPLRPEDVFSANATSGSKTTHGSSAKDVGDSDHANDQRQ
jgi:hypothetical protein